MIYYGNKMLNLVEEVRGSKFKDNELDHACERTSGRLLEECVELCLAFRMDPGTVMMHVVDALTNESRKQSRSTGGFVFPSEINVNEGSQIEELADVQLWLDYITELAVFNESVRDIYVNRKFTRLQNEKEENKLVVVDENLYRAIK